MSATNPEVSTRRDDRNHGVLLARDEVRGEAALGGRFHTLISLGTPFRIALTISSVAFVYALLDMRHHGVTCDEPALHYAGDRTLYWLQHLGQAGALDLLGPDPADFYSSFERRPAAMDPVHYPVLPGLVGAICNWLLGERLGLVSSTDGHHLGLVLLHVFALMLYGMFSIRLLGRLGGTAATVALALFPCAVGHSFNNAKDWPCAMFYGVSMLALANGVLDARWRDLMVAGALLGVALAGKLNAIFALGTLALWAPAVYLLLYRAKSVPTAVVAGVLSIPYVAGAVFFISWPWLYQGQLPDWWMHVHEYVYFMLNFGVSERPTWSAHGVRCVAFMTPPLLLVCALAYAVGGGWRADPRAKAVWLLLLLWFALPILRISMPGSNYYDANRHFIEYVPALCALAGAGAAWLARGLMDCARSGRFGAWVMDRAHPLMACNAAASLLVLVWPVLEYRPHETTYFNVFAGGLGGAQRDGLFMEQPPAGHLVNGTEGDYWFGSLRPALATAARLLAPGQTLSLCGPPLWLAEANWPERDEPRLSADIEDSSVVFATPREFFCNTAFIRELESKRPILKRVERGGGLIYELLGPIDNQRHPVVTSPSVYTARGWYNEE